MTHPPASTKSSHPWLSNSIKVELFSIALVVLLIGGVLTPIVTQAQISDINCQSDQNPCPTEANQQLQSLLHQPMLLTNLTSYLESSNLTNSYQVNTLSLSLPSTVNIDLTTRPPSYFLMDEGQVMAVATDGSSSIWSNPNLPNDIPQVNLTIESKISLQPLIDGKFNSELHSQILNFLNTLKVSQLAYQSLELIDSETIKIWLSSQDWALLDLTQLDAIQKLSTVLNHPDFQNRVETGYNLDLRFQYPLLLKAD